MKKEFPRKFDEGNLSKLISLSLSLSHVYIVQNIEDLTSCRTCKYVDKPLNLAGLKLIQNSYQTAPNSQSE
jgi:hypothetical protein